MLKKTLPYMFFALISSSTIAANKIVVVPMEAESAGASGSTYTAMYMPYPAWMTASAEHYYSNQASYGANTADNRKQPVLRAGTFKNMQLYCSSAPAAGSSVTIALQTSATGSGGWTDSDLALTITNSDGMYVTNTSDEVAVTAGTFIVFKYLENNGVAASANCGVTVEFHAS